MSGAEAMAYSLCLEKQKQSKTSLISSRYRVPANRPCGEMRNGKGKFPYRVTSPVTSPLEFHGRRVASLDKTRSAVVTMTE